MVGNTRTFALAMALSLTACRTAQLAPSQRDCSPGAEVICDARIRQECYGCNPLDERLRNRMAMACLPQFVRAEVSQCANGAFDLAVKDKFTAKGTVEGCIKSVQKLDPDIKAELIKVVDTALTGDKQYDEWLVCYDCHLKGTCGPK